MPEFKVQPLCNTDKSVAGYYYFKWAKWCKEQGYPDDVKGMFVVRAGNPWNAVRKWWQKFTTVKTEQRILQDVFVVVDEEGKRHKVSLYEKHTIELDMETLED